MPTPWSVAAPFRESEWRSSEGAVFSPGQRLGSIVGPLRWILRAERPLLNLLQRGSGIATTTRSYVEQLRGTGCRCCTRGKTLPGLRAFDVRAVLAGGGALHRIDLSREVLVKDNHWRALEALAGSMRDARAAASGRGVRSFQVEVESEAQLEAACAAGATRVLFENQSPETLEDWAARARLLSPGIEVEASGGIDFGQRARLCGSRCGFRLDRGAHAQRLRPRHRARGHGRRSRALEIGALPSG